MNEEPINPNRLGLAMIHKAVRDKTLAIIKQTNNDGTEDFVLSVLDEDGTVSAIAKMMTKEELKKLDNTQIISNQVIASQKGHDLLKSKKIRRH